MPEKRPKQSSHGRKQPACRVDGDHLPLAAGNPDEEPAPVGAGHHRSRSGFFR